MSSLQFNLKNYKPKPHPMQSRIDEFRSIPSLYKLPVEKEPIPFAGVVEIGDSNERK